MSRPNSNPRDYRALRSPVLAVLGQHVEEAAHLRHVRTVQVRAPNARLMNLQRLDGRIAAHLDGIAVAGEPGQALCRQALDPVSNGALFTAVWGALEARDMVALDGLLALAQALPECRAGWLSALGWVEPARLRGVSTILLGSSDAWRVAAGLAACELHRVDPQASLGPALKSADAALRWRGLRTAGRLGRRDLLDACLAALADADDQCAFEAAQAALLLGERRRALRALEDRADAGGERADEALAWSLVALPEAQAHSRLARLSQKPAAARTLVRGVGLLGDPHFVPWLIERMHEPELARIAGESFSLLTGLDLAYLDLDGAEPQQAAGGPGDEPDGTPVGLDDDESLPWPDPQRIAAWWADNGAVFSAGQRYFMGAPPSPAHCLQVLRKGFQRQRYLAALHLSLMQPGTPLFNIAAPAWRQSRWLAAMEA